MKVYENIKSIVKHQQLDMSKSFAQQKHGNSMSERNKYETNITIGITSKSEFSNMWLYVVLYCVYGA